MKALKEVLTTSKIQTCVNNRNIFFKVFNALKKT